MSWLDHAPLSGRIGSLAAHARARAHLAHLAMRVRVEIRRELGKRGAGPAVSAMAPVNLLVYLLAWESADAIETFSAEWPLLEPGPVRSVQWPLSQ